MERADLTDANLVFARLIDADLRDAILVDANLTGANLNLANLQRADLSQAYMAEANLMNCVLAGANLMEISLAYTQLTNLDLKPLIEASDVKHLGPSIVDWRSVAKSLGAGTRRLEGFLLDTGMPQVFVTYQIDCARTVDEADLFSMLQSVFISYGAPDEAFAGSLHDSLGRSGVKTWFFPTDAIPGEKLHREMWRGIQSLDRVLIICSRAAFGQGGFLNEVELAFEKEAKGGKTILLPITLDDYVFSQEFRSEHPELSARLTGTRVIADFRGAGSGEGSVFDKGIALILKAVEKCGRSD